MGTLGITSVDEAMAFLSENADMEQLLQALVEKGAGAEAAPAAEAEPAQMAASQSAMDIVAGKLVALSKRVAGLEDDKRRSAVIADGISAESEHFATMLKLHRDDPAGYRAMLPLAREPEPTTDRVVALSGAVRKPSTRLERFMQANRGKLDELARLAPNLNREALAKNLMQQEAGK